MDCVENESYIMQIKNTYEIKGYFCTGSNSLVISANKHFVINSKQTKYSFIQIRVCSRFLTFYNIERIKTNYQISLIRLSHNFNLFWF